eukprot:CAMPEP_0117778486 /NCGR_PEP_ID=MMETSP0948-20121206/1022_1 /TAXON_ID=44440 /ORGANISM="Chattonella subsalsa, Strain CCMP2191" /LENGTH=211 /DNA_ID=CAMNT_0005605821 /DNA_START=67 /DNA_END=699 /DNA_ORIENTATION=+
MSKTVAAIAVAGLVGASAFQTPALPQTNVVSKPSSMTMMAEMSKSVPFLTKPEKLDGSMAGDEGFDPLKLSEIDDVGIDLYWMREAELKHARVAMLAVAGTLFCETVGSAPGFPAGACQTDLFWEVWSEKPGVIGGGLLGFAVVEIISGIATTAGRESGDRAPGDFGFDPLGFSKNPAAAKDLALKEIRNGRLAMWAAAGMLLQGVTTHEG